MGCMKESGRIKRNERCNEALEKREEPQSSHIDDFHSEDYSGLRGSDCSAKTSTSSRYEKDLSFFGFNTIKLGELIG